MEKAKKSVEEKAEARKALLSLLLIILVALAIIWLGFNIVTGVISLVLFFIVR
jgi:hypothetical protein